MSTWFKDSPRCYHFKFYWCYRYLISRRRRFSGRITRAAVLGIRSYAHQTGYLPQRDAIRLQALTEEYTPPKLQSAESRLKRERLTISFTTPILDQTHLRQEFSRAIQQLGKSTFSLWTQERRPAKTAHYWNDTGTCVKLNLNLSLL